MNIKVLFTEREQSFTPAFEERDRGFDCLFESVIYLGKRAEEYAGAYDVTPLVEAQTLATKDKHMTDDVTVKAIPYYNVGNNAGGSTAYIGTL